MINKIESENLSILSDIFSDCKYDKVLIDSVLEGHYGTAHAVMKEGKAETARLDTGAFTILSGNPNSDYVDELMNLQPIHIVTPQNTKWEFKLKELYGEWLFPMEFIQFDHSTLDRTRLESFITDLSEDYSLCAFNQELASKALEDLGNEYLFENFYDIDDFLSRGIGFCIVHDNTIVSAATSVAKSNTAIDIEVETLAAYKRKGLASAVSAKLLLACIEKKLKPTWLAANKASEQLALKLGYTKSGEYISFNITAE